MSVQTICSQVIKADGRMKVGFRGNLPLYRCTMGIGLKAINDNFLDVHICYQITQALRLIGG
jgi:hypothetical protein